jgi:hypothetical protein
MVRSWSRIARFNPCTFRRTVIPLTVPYSSSPESFLGKRCEKPAGRLIHASVVHYEGVKLGVKLTFQCVSDYFFDPDLTIQKRTLVCGANGWDKDMIGCQFSKL